MECLAQTMAKDLLHAACVVFLCLLSKPRVRHTLCSLKKPLTLRRLLLLRATFTGQESVEHLSPAVLHAQ